MTVAKLGLLYVEMHMRGDLVFMLNKLNSKYSNPCSKVVVEVAWHVWHAKLAQIPSWKIIIDPRFGFEKKSQKNVELMRNCGFF